MGIRLFSSDEYDSPIIAKIGPKGNPSPSNYKIIDTLTFGNMLIVEIQYPDCNNYEGKKILVYEGITASQLREQKLIDPHFSENEKFHSPIARFEPTKRGWKMAESFAKMWSMKR